MKEYESLVFGKCKAPSKERTASFPTAITTKFNYTTQKPKESPKQHQQKLRQIEILAL